MSYLLHLKRYQIDDSTRWIVKLNTKTGKVREVKQIFNPKEYIKIKNPRKLYNQNEVIKILEDDKQNG
tara:strand:+ start:287 stop:490 length:204 start_codon:yes stop_codon:yes gene_type:complete